MPGTRDSNNVVAFLLLPTALFFEYFTLENAQIISSILNVWADDTACVAVTNIIKCQTAYRTALAPPAIGCGTQRRSARRHRALSQVGENVFTFGVYQREGGPFGLLYDGKVVTAGECRLKLRNPRQWD